MADTPNAERVQAGGLRLRKNIANLSADELQAFRDAMVAMQKVSDNRGYNYMAGLHGVPQWFCWHMEPGKHEWLAWHRAYLYNFELNLEVCSQMPGITLPWWDWTSADAHQNGIPAAYNDASGPDGKDNPLYKATISVPNPQQSWPTETARAPGDPGDLPAAQDINALVQNTTSWSDFLTQLYNPHANVHGWVGGTMDSLPFAAYDPLFWAHHCFLDRVWYLWQVANPNGGPSPQDLALVLPPFNMTVGDTISIHKLGYEYASSGVVVAGTAQ